MASLGILRQLSIFYSRQGRFDESERCVRKLLGAEPVSNDEYEEENRQTAQRTLQIIKEHKEEIAKPDQGGGCYIATACYGSYAAHEVIILRKYRDEKLLRNKIGELFVRLYYKYSPYFANRLKEHSVLNVAIKKYILDNIVKMIKTR